MPSSQRTTIGNLRSNLRRIHPYAQLFVKRRPSLPDSTVVCAKEENGKTRFGLVRKPDGSFLRAEDQLQSGLPSLFSINNEDWIPF